VDEERGVRHDGDDPHAGRFEGIPPRVLHGRGELHDGERLLLRRDGAEQRRAREDRIEGLPADAHLAQVVAELGAAVDQPVHGLALGLDDREARVLRHRADRHDGELPRRVGVGGDEEEMRTGEGRRLPAGQSRDHDGERSGEGHDEPQRASVHDETLPARGPLAGNLHSIAVQRPPSEWRGGASATPGAVCVAMQRDRVRRSP
jgi:hypothetical protein